MLIDAEAHVSWKPIGNLKLEGKGTVTRSGNHVLKLEN